jgi:hypothetical protein
VCVCVCGVHWSSLWAVDEQLGTVLRINLQTGTQKNLHDTYAFQSVRQIVTDPTGRVFVPDFYGGKVVAFDNYGDGTATILNTGSTYIEAIAFDATNNVLYFGSENQQMSVMLKCTPSNAHRR